MVAAPMSFTGSAGRIMRLADRQTTAARISLGTVAALLVVVAWTFVLAWYVCFGLLLVPYRLVRRGQRKRKREALRHREMLAAVQAPRDIN